MAKTERVVSHEERFARPVLRRLTISTLLRRALGSGLIACSILPSVASAQAPAQLPYGLGGSAAWRENIELGVGLWQIAHEHARRALLLNRCTALDRSFPSRPATAMVAASTEVFRWMTGEAYSELPTDPYLAAAREVLPVLARHVFSVEELASWEALRNSPQAQRGWAAQEVVAALDMVAEHVVDTNSGRHWGWPLARLARLADAHGLGAEIDATFETLEPGAAARLRSISLVPGETPADEWLLRRVMQSPELLAKEFVGKLSPPDRDAYDRIGQVDLLERWSMVTQMLPRLTLNPAVGALPGLGPREAMTVSGFCASLGLSACQPGEQLHSALTKYRAVFEEAMRSSYAPVHVAYQIVRGLPSSGCPELRR